MHRDTLIVHAGYRKTSESGPFLAGPQFSSTYTTPGDPSRHTLSYGRFHNPTWTAWEDALGVLEGGQSVAFASGMAAVSAVFGVSLRRGDIVVLPADGYYAIRNVASTWLESIGVQVRLAATRSNAQTAALEGARLLWIESPTNPLLDVCDISGLVDAARAKAVLVAVDNTTATPYLQQPLALGATFVVASDSKGANRPQRPDPRARGDAGRSACRGGENLAGAAWRDSRPDGSVARASIAADAAGSRQPSMRNGPAAG